MKRLLSIFLTSNLIVVFSSTVVLASPYGCGAYGTQTYQNGSCGTTTSTGGGTTSGGTTSGGTSSSTTKKKAASAAGGSSSSSSTPEAETTAPTEETTPSTNQEPTISIGPVKLPANEKVAVANKKLPVTGVQALGILGILLVATAMGMWFWYYRRKHKDDPPRPGSGGAPPTIVIPPASRGGSSGSVGPNIGA
jgi:cobalamin biosynthesis Mg chelatase CobN